MGWTVRRSRRLFSNPGRELRREAAEKRARKRHRRWCGDRPGSYE
jgi:hypothetical protein